MAHKDMMSLLDDLNCLKLTPKPSVTDKPESKSDVLFNPPLGRQRYIYCQQLLLQDPTIKQLTDLGSGNCQIMRYLKSVPNLRLCSFVEQVYHEAIEAVYCAAPLVCDYIYGRVGATEPLHVDVYCGNMFEPDSRILNKTDAITMIEVIEHLDDHDLHKLPQLIFEVYQPQLCIITTPNREFNVMFSRNGQPIRFRHPDHKFEWTRAQFIEWCTFVTSSYPAYSVTYDGVGHLPGSDGLGPCTQIAIFRRNPSVAKIPIIDLPEPWNMVVSFSYNGSQEQPKQQEESHIDWSQYSSLMP